MDFLAPLRECKAVLQGHFLLASGLHSDTYFQCAKIFERPEIADRLFAALAEKWRAAKADIVAGPAIGGIIPAYELAKKLRSRSVYLEKVEEKFVLRRGFEVGAGEKVIVAEDVVTTGGSALGVCESLRGMGAQVLGVAAIVFRGQGNPFDVDLQYLLAMAPPTYTSDRCPLCAEGIPVVKPGGLKK